MCIPAMYSIARTVYWAKKITKGFYGLSLIMNLIENIALSCKKKIQTWYFWEKQMLQEIETK